LVYKLRINPLRSLETIKQTPTLLRIPLTERIKGNGDSDEEEFHEETGDTLVGIKQKPHGAQKERSS
jgi:hypothetical protein